MHSRVPKTLGGVMTVGAKKGCRFSNKVSDSSGGTPETQREVQQARWPALSRARPPRFLTSHEHQVLRNAAGCGAPPIAGRRAMPRGTRGHTPVPGVERVTNRLAPSSTGEWQVLRARRCGALPPDLPIPVSPPHLVSLPLDGGAISLGTGHHRRHVYPAAGRVEQANAAYRLPASRRPTPRVLDGRDLPEYDPDELRAAVGVIFQDFIRYDLSARENIAIGRIDARDDLRGIRQAARSARGSTHATANASGQEQQCDQRQVGRRPEPNGRPPRRG